MTLPPSFFARDSDRWIPSVLTRGPWDDRFQHGGPPCSLLAGALAAFGGPDAPPVSRLWFELLRPVPIAPLTVEVAVERAGSTVQRLRGTLSAAGTPHIVARALRIHRRALTIPAAPTPTPWPDPETLPPFEIPFFPNPVGYHRAVELRVARGNWGTTPIRVWARPRVPLIAKERTTPLQALVLLADAQSGMGPPLDPSEFSFVNPDLAVALERPPEGSWFGFDVRSVAGAHGAGLSQSAVRDARGEVARCSQSLVIAPRTSAAP